LQSASLPPPRTADGRVCALHEAHGSLSEEMQNL